MEQGEKIKIIVVDDEEFSKNAIKYTLSRESKIKVLSYCSDEKELFDYLKNPENPMPDIILLDMAFGGAATLGNDIAKRINEQFKEKDNQTFKFKIIVYSGKYNYSDSPEIKRTNVNVIADALKAGAMGFYR